jgi:hypothetical protein
MAACDRGDPDALSALGKYQAIRSETGTTPDMFYSVDHGWVLKRQKFGGSRSNNGPPEG